MTNEYVEVDFFRVAVLLAAGVPVIRKTLNNGKLEYIFEKTQAVIVISRLSRDEIIGSWKQLADEYKAIKKEWKDIQEMARR